MIVFQIAVSSCASREIDALHETVEPETVVFTKLAFQPQLVDSTADQIILNPLHHQILAYLAEVQVDPNRLAYSISDLTTGREWHHNEDVAFRSGSVYKLPLAMLYYDAINQGWMDPGQMIEYEDWIEEPGGYIYEAFEYGDQFPLWDVLHYVIAYSDNVAGHMLYANYGGWDKVRRDGLRYSEYKDEAHYYDLAGYFTTRYLNDVMEYLYEHQAEYSTLMNNLASAAPDTYLNSAVYGLAYQKIGTVEFYYNAAGLVQAEHPYTICVMTAFGESGHQVMGVINQIAYGYFNGE